MLPNTLSAADRRRYARHVLLPEIGEAGQARLLATSVVLPADADPRAASATAEYLARAGVQLTADSQTGSQMALPTGREIAALAGDPLLEEAAATLAGAFAAVEAIKRTLGVGTPARLPDALSLSGAQVT